MHRSKKEGLEVRYLVGLLLTWSLWGQVRGCVALEGCSFLGQGRSVFIGFPVREEVFDSKKALRFQVVESLWGLEGAEEEVAVEFSAGPSGRELVMPKPETEPILPQKYLVVAEPRTNGLFRPVECMRVVHSLDAPEVAQLFQGIREGLRSQLRGSVAVPGRPAKRPSVKLWLEGAAGAHSAEVEASGYDLLRDVVPGRYKLSVEANGYVEVSRWPEWAMGTKVERTDREILVLPGGCGTLRVNLAPDTRLHGRLPLVKLSEEKGRYLIYASSRDGLWDKDLTPEHERRVEPGKSEVRIRIVKGD